MPPAPTTEKDQIAQKNGYNSWEEWKSEIEEDMGRPVCGALTRKYADKSQPHFRPPCRAKQRENGRCHMHGGRSLRGIDHPNWQGRGWSKDLPTRLIDRFKLALDDEDLTSLVDEIRLIDVRIGELLSKLGNNEGLWGALQYHVEQIKKELAVDPDINVIEQRVEKIEDIFEEAHKDDTLWHRIQDAVDQRRKLAEAEHRREEKLETHMSVREARTVFSAIQMAIKQEADDETRKRIMSRIRQIMDGPREWPPQGTSTKADFDDEDEITEADYSIVDD